MNLASGKKIKMLRVDGGITKNNFTMQFQSDILGIPIEIAENPETTVLGVGYMAGLSCGVWNSIDEIRSEFTISKKYIPNMTTQKEEILLGWNQAVKRAMNWENDTKKVCAN